MPAADVIDRALRLMTISEALSDLSQAHREALVETYFKERTVSEAAEVLRAGRNRAVPGVLRAALPEALA